MPKLLPIVVQSGLWLDPIVARGFAEPKDGSAALGFLQTRFLPGDGSVFGDGIKARGRKGGTLMADVLGLEAARAIAAIASSQSAYENGQSQTIDLLKASVFHSTESGAILAPTLTGFYALIFPGFTALLPPMINEDRRSVFLLEAELAAAQHYGNARQSKFLTRIDGLADRFEEIRALGGSAFSGARFVTLQLHEAEQPSTAHARVAAIATLREQTDRFAQFARLIGYELMQPAFADGAPRW